MRKKICFVGFAEDKPESLQSLKDAIAGLGGEWDCTYVPNGPRALEVMVMRTEPFDAVVSNMHLPGMNGAELLQQVGNLHPKTLRFVLGSVADQELVINCIGGTHHFIAQPCKPQDLVSTILRAFALDAWLSSDQLRAIIPKFRRLPSLPMTYFEVLKQVDSPRSNVQSIGQVIARDPAATARLLQMVNSAAFALDQKVTEPAHAVSLLGLETVKSLVLCLQVFSPNDQAKKAGVSFDHLWDHSFSVATIAREIAKLHTNDARLASDAFTAGLLHDVGRIVLASNLPDEYAAAVAAARQKSRLLFAEEAEHIGVTHAQAGAYLLGLWGMPAPLVEAAALHHTPSHTFTRQFSLLTVVHVANVLAYEKDTCSEGLVPPELDLEYLDSLGLGDRPGAWRARLGINRPAPAPPRVAPSEVPSPEVSPSCAVSPSPVVFSSPAPSAPAPVKPEPAKPARVTPAPVTPTPASAPVAQASPPPRKPRYEPARKPVTAASSSSSTTPSIGRRKGLVRLLAPAAGIAAVAALLWWLNGPNSGADVRARIRSGSDSTNTPAKSVSTAPVPVRPRVASPVVTNTALTVTNVATQGFDSVKVQAIFYRPAKPTVMINGKTLGVGDQINGLKVLSIGPANVVLGQGGERRDFQVKPK